MVLGYLALGMISGAAAAVFWVATGGHVLIAIALYSLVAIAVVLASAVTTWLWLHHVRHLGDAPIEAADMAPVRIAD